MRTMRIGDKVRSYHNPLIVGKVVDVLDVPSQTWLMEGTQTSERYIILEMQNRDLIRLKASDLYVEEWA